MLAGVHCTDGEEESGTHLQAAYQRGAKNYRTLDKMCFSLGLSSIWLPHSIHVLTHTLYYLKAMLGTSITLILTTILTLLYRNPTPKCLYTQYRDMIHIVLPSLGTTTSHDSHLMGTMGEDCE